MALLVGLTSAACENRPMGSTYSPAAVSAFFDEYARREWDRLDRDAHSRLIGHLHALFLSEVVRAGQTVLDAGCGAGRFARQCLEAGARVTLVDISRVQLDLALERCEDIGGGIGGAHEADVSDLNALGDESFDVVVCYGSVLCYLVDETPRALAEMVARVRPGGSFVVSGFFGRPDYWDIDSVVRTGTLPTHPEVEHPPRHFFTSGELRALLADAGLADITLATAPGVSSGLFDRTAAIEQSAEGWKTLLSLEEATFREPGLLDAGEFILARGSRPTTGGPW
jgi:ubiquinone/menaquinone biosynthesis C-methylase UbiE